MTFGGSGGRGTRSGSFEIHQHGAWLDEGALGAADGTARPARRAAADGHPTLCAPMPATVVRIVAPVGTRVPRGATIVLLEAMKMELPLRAPHDAVVTAIRCREGELVQPGHVLLDLE